MKFDLHSHSYYSDGTLAPAEVVRQAHRAGVSLLSLTDHDSVTGIAEAAREAAALGMRFLPGIEINTNEPDQIHILGYGIDPAHPRLTARLEELRQVRRERAAAMLKKLQELKIDVSAEDLDGVSRESLGRPHIADALRKKGYVRTRQEAFRRYLMVGKPAYVGPVGPGIQEAIAIIRGAGGLAVLAHPGFVKRGLDYPKWVEWGLGGVEAYYPTHTANYIRRLAADAAPFGLLLTGGSDYHGPGTDRDVIGAITPPQDVYDRVLETFLKKV